MTKLTLSQQDLVTAALPSAYYVAARYGRVYGQGHDWRGAVQLALCQRVGNYRPEKASVAKWGRVTAHYACRGIIQHWSPMPVAQMTEEIESRLQDREETEFEDRQTALSLLEGLDERKRRILWRIYVDGQSQTAVAHELGVSGAWIWRLRTQALAQLRERA